MRPPFLVISRGLAGRTVVELLRNQFRLTPGDVRALLKRNGIKLGGEVCRDLTRKVCKGQRLQIDTLVDRPHESPRKDRETLPPLAGQIRIVYLDDDIVVVDKPAGLTTVRHATEKAAYGGRAQRFLPTTLVDLLGKILRKQQPTQGARVRAVHRLDKETTGLLVLARTPQAERQLGLQFRAHQIERTYQALVRGQAHSETIATMLVPDRGDGRRGSGQGKAGQKAVTHVRVLKELGPYTLVECKLETGRTHQVRIHLGERGTPLCGERVYDRPLHGQPYADESGAGRPFLHAATLAFDHPISQERKAFSAPLPEDMKQLLKRLKARE